MSMRRKQRNISLLLLVQGILFASLAAAAGRPSNMAEDIATMLDGHKPFIERDAAIQKIQGRILNKEPYDRDRLMAEVFKTFEGNDRTIANNASWILVSIGTAAVPRLLADLDRPDRVGQMAATTLGYYESPAQLEIYPKVIEKLRSGKVEARLNAAEALDRTGWVFSVHHDEKPAVAISAALTRALRDDDPQVRRRALGSLSRGLGPYAAGSIDQLVAELDGPDSGMRIMAAEALGRIGAPATPRIEELFSHSTGTARMLAAAALAISDHSREETIPVLIQAQSSEDSGVRNLTLNALAELGPRALSAQNDLIKRLNDPKDEDRSGVIYALQQLGSPPASIVPRLVEIIKQDKWGDQNAIVLLGLIGPPARAAIPELISKIHGQAGSVPCNPAEALVRIGPASIPALLPVARERDEYRRAWASWALAQLAADARVPLKSIDDALCDSSHEVVFRTKDGLRRAGVKTGRLARFYDVREQEFRSMTCRGSYTPPAAAVPHGAVPPVQVKALEREIIPELLKKLNGEKRREALWTLSELGPYAAKAVPKLLQDLPAAGSDDRRTIARMLGSIGAAPELCVPALTELMKDSDTWTSDAAFGSLALFGDAAKSAAPAMLEKLKSGKISSYSEENFASLRGPAARAALPYYRGLSAAEDEVKATRGIRMMLRIAPDDAATRTAALAEAGRGSSRRRCLVTGELFKALGGRPEIQDLPLLSDESCRKNLEGQPGFWGRAGDLPPKPASGSLPRLKIQLSLTKRTFYSGEPIEVTPNILDWQESAEKYPSPSFFRDAGFMGGFDLFPDVRTSSGILVEAGGASEVYWGQGNRRRGAQPSSTMANMMANGMVTPRHGSVYAIGRPATVYIRDPGLYKLAIPESVVHVKFSTGPLSAVSADPVDVRIIPATDAFVARTLREIGNELTSTNAMERGRATERLRNLNNERAIPILLRCLEDEYKNVLMPALLGLLEYPRPQSVAREIRKAIGEGRPTRPAQIQWYADVLARTEHGWPDTDFRSRIRVDAESAKWRLLLEHRQKEAFRGSTLSPADAVEGLKNGFVSPETPGACNAAWKELFNESKPARLGVVGQIVTKCGDKKSSKVLWKIVRSDKFDSSARSSACRKLYDLGDKDAFDFILADMGAPKPVLYHTIESLPVMKAAPRAVADVVLRKLASDDSSQTRFASTLLWSLDAMTGQSFDLPLDPAKLRETLLACGERACDSVVWGHVARYLGTRSPKDALGVIQAMLPRCKKDPFAGCGGPVQILAMLPADISGPLVRKFLKSSDPKESLVMLRALASVTQAQGKPYFGDLLALFKKSPSDETRGYAALALQRISQLPSAQFPSSTGPAAVDPETASRWIKEWESWRNKHGEK